LFEVIDFVALLPFCGIYYNSVGWVCVYCVVLCCSIASLFLFAVVYVCFLRLNLFDLLVCMFGFLIMLSGVCLLFCSVAVCFVIVVIGVAFGCAVVICC